MNFVEVQHRVRGGATTNNKPVLRTGRLLVTRNKAKITTFYNNKHFLTFSKKKNRLHHTDIHIQVFYLSPGGLSINNKQLVLSFHNKQHKQRIVIRWKYLYNIGGIFSSCVTFVWATTQGDFVVYSNLRQSWSDDKS